MPCQFVVLKEKIVPFGKTLFIRGGGTAGGVIPKNLMSLGVRKKMSQVRKITPPRDFINERSLIETYNSVIRHFRMKGGK